MKGGVVIAGCGSEPVALSGSQYLATCPASFDAASSPESLTAVFSATANSGLAGSTSAVDLLSVAKAATTTSIAASSNSPAAGASVSYRATVTPAQSGSALPSGVVEFMDGEQAIGSCASASLSGSAAVCKITATAGTHMISAAYSGDANFSASRSPALSSAVGAPRPVSTAPPKVTGTPKPGKTLTCNTGQWTGAPRFSFAWNRDGVALYANVAHRRRVVQLDEGSTLSCTVTATNGGGSSSVTSPTVRVAVPFVKGCPAATGLLSDTTLGLIHLGMTRRQARHAYRRHSNRGRQYEDFFCLTPIGVRVGYGSPKLTRALKRATRARYADHVVWASTSNPRYALDKVRVGESAATAAKLLGTGPPLHIGLNYWYLAVKHKLTLVLKVRDEAVQEVGIATNALTHTRAEQRTLMHSFY